MTTTGRYACECGRIFQSYEALDDHKCIDDTFTEMCRRVAREAAMFMRVINRPELWGDDDKWDAALNEWFETEGLKILKGGEMIRVPERCEACGMPVNPDEWCEHIDRLCRYSKGYALEHEGERQAIIAKTNQAKQAQSHYEAVRELFLKMVDRGMGGYAERTLWESAERAINFADGERPK